MAFNCIAGHLTGFTQSPAVSNQTRKQRDGDLIASCTARRLCVARLAAISSHNLCLCQRLKNHCEGILTRFDILGIIYANQLRHARQGKRPRKESGSWVRFGLTALA